MSAICSLWKFSASGACLFQIAQGKSYDYILINNYTSRIDHWLIMFGETWISVKGLLTSLLLSDMLRNIWKIIYEYIIYKPYFDNGKSSAIFRWFSTQVWKCSGNIEKFSSGDLWKCLEIS